MSALTDYFSSLANKFRSKTGKSDTLTPNDMVDEVDTVYQKGYDDATPVTQTKTAPYGVKLSAQTITPDTGKLLSSVTVPASFGGNIATVVQVVDNTGTENNPWISLSSPYPCYWLVFGYLTGSAIARNANNASWIQNTTTNNWVLKYKQSTAEITDTPARIYLLECGEGGGSIEFRPSGAFYSPKCMVITIPK